MRLRRIRVPHFRALRSIDLSLDSGFSKQIFPLGSWNGGGKSTLLQLTFALLHCSMNKLRQVHLRTLLEGYAHESDSVESTLAEFDLEVDEGSVTLSFLILGSEFLQEGLALPRDDTGDFSLYRARRELRARLGEQRADQRNLLDNDRPMSPNLRRRLSARLGQSHSALPRSELRAFYIESIASEMKDSESELEVINASIARVEHLLEARRLHFVTDFEVRGGRNESRTSGLCLRVGGIGHESVASVMAKVCDSIFLLGPATQQYLFVPHSTRRQFIEEDESPRGGRSRHWFEHEEGAAVSYAKEIRKAATELPGFYPYDWLSVRPLINLFRQARDRDFASAVKSGSYANNYTSMLAEVNLLLRNKRVQPMPDLSGLHFTVSFQGSKNDVTVGIEDLSRGELKRLMIYAWLKSSEAGEAVVLIDEIETSFHPDWQAGVVRDLWDWAPQYQYLLATHSYEVCEALPPAQVLELHPWRKAEAREEVSLGGDSE